VTVSDRRTARRGPRVTDAPGKDTDDRRTTGKSASRRCHPASPQGEASTALGEHKLPGLGTPPLEEHKHHLGDIPPPHKERPAQPWVSTSYQDWAHPHWRSTSTTSGSLMA